MAEAGPQGLPYGQFGQAVYDPKSREWRFTRQPEPLQHLQSVGDPEVLCEPTTSAQDVEDDTSGDLAPNLRLAKQIKQLSRIYPEVQPAASDLPPLLRASEAISTAAAGQPLRPGTLLAIGLIPSELTHRRVEVLAHPTGPTGSDLYLTILNPQKRYWNGGKASWLNIPAVTGEVAIWRGLGVAIEQVCFAQPVGHGDVFLAVRLQTETVVFRPVIRRRAVLGSGSALDVNAVARIPIDFETRAPHVNVAFYASRTSRFAIVDTSGQCVVFEVDSHGRREYKQISALALDSDSDSGSESGPPSSDEWARVTWILDKDHLLLATRKGVLLFDIARTLSRILELDLMLVKDKAVVLDIQLLPDRKDVVCVLTSTRLVICRLSEDDVEGAVREAVLCGWRHYMSADSNDLRLRTFQDDDDVQLLLCADGQTAQTVFRLCKDDLGRLYAVDPYTFDSSEGGTITTDILCRRLEYGGRQDISKQASSRLPGFYASLSLCNDFAVRQSFIASNRGERIAFPTQKAPLTTPKSRIAKDGFVVDDNEHGGRHAEFRPQPVSRHVKRRIASLRASSGHQWTLSYRAMADALSHSPLEAALSMSEVAARVQELFTGQEMNEATSLTLQQVAHIGVDVSDIDEAANNLRDLVESASVPVVSLAETDEDKPAQRSIQAIVVPRDHQRLAGDGRLISTYDAIIQQHVRTLSSNVPGRTRLAKAEAARRIAADIVLSSLVLRKSDPYQQNETQQTENQTANSWELPVRATSSQISAGSQMSQLRSSQTALPTPSPTATPSVTTASGYPSSMAAPEVSRLSTYVTFEKPAPPPLPRALNRVMNHWTPGADPAAYDWLSTYRQLEETSEDFNEDMTEKERARLQRRATRHIKRQRREAEASQRQQIASSQAPTISASQIQGPREMPSPPLVMGSQPTPTVVASSQSQGGGLMPPPASQVERGRFGGKPPKKKKRKQGF